VTTGHSASFKCLRLLRLLRILRAVKIFPKLLAFTRALLEMFSLMSWIFLFLSIFLVCWAIILTRELGQSSSARKEVSLAATEEEAIHLVQEFFQDIPTSLYTLFRVSTQDDWMDIAGPMILLNPAWQLFFIVFIIFMSWTMISVLTAVASESMVAATTDQKEQEMRKAEQMAKNFIEFLREAFKKADADGSGTLDKEEFESMMKKEFVINELRAVGFSMNEEEILKAWDLLDFERVGELTIDSFVAGLSYIQEKLTTRHVMNLSYMLKRVSRRFDNSVRKLVDELSTLRDQNQEILDCLQSQEKLKDQQEFYLWLWHQWMSKIDPKAVKASPPPVPKLMLPPQLPPAVQVTAAEPT